MTNLRVQRRLAAVLAADVVGYSKLMGADEEGTLARLKAHRRELIDPSLVAHGGRLVKTTGDGMLVEFPSVVDAVRCAVEIQGGMASRNRAQDEGHRIAFRIGINLGDVIVEDDDIHGDGVNVAARLEGLSDPGGICISRGARDEVRDRLDLTLEDLGEQQVKNIARPVRAFRVRLSAAGAEAQPAVGPAPATAQPPLPDKPSIAVLPFTNMSGDPEQEYFADGMAEDIITALSRFHQFFVIARNSCFIYKGKAVDVRQVGRELGMRYVLEGSGRRGANRLRITVQLVEAETGSHLWAERYDGGLEDVFDLQDCITEGVVGAIEPGIERAEIERARRKPPESLDAYDLYLRAVQLATIVSPEDNETGLQLAERALQVDPSLIVAHGAAAAILTQRMIWGAFDSDARKRMIDHAEAILSSNTDDALAIAAAGFGLGLGAHRFDEACRALDRAITMNPNSALALVDSVAVRSVLGDVETTLEHAERAMRLNPFDPWRFAVLGCIGNVQFLAERYDKSADAAIEAIQVNPRFLPAFTIAIASLTELGRTGQAEQLVNRLLASHPYYRWSEAISHIFAVPDHQAKLAATMRKSKLPE